MKKKEEEKEESWRFPPFIEIKNKVNRKIGLIGMAFVLKLYQLNQMKSKTIVFFFWILFIIKQC